MKNINLVLAVFLLLGAPIARADDVVILERTASNFDTWAATSNDRPERVLAAISRETGVPVATLEAQRAQTNLGYGGLFIANSLASATGKTFDEIAALKASGHGWGWIAKENNVKLGPIVSQARHVDKAFKNDNGKVKKLKKDEANRSEHGRGNGHGHDAGPKSHGNFHAKGHGKGH